MSVVPVEICLLAVRCSRMAETLLASISAFEVQSLC